MRPELNAHLLLGAVEAARNGVIITDATVDDNPIVYSNPAFAELTGYELSEILGKNCRFLQGTDRHQGSLQLIRSAIKEGQAVTALLRNYRKDGQLFWNELSISPVRDETGRLVNFIGIQNDVTARIEAERRVSNFYSVISHELKTPLTAIDGALGAIQDGTAGRMSKQAQRLVEIAVDNCSRLINLVEQILDWKRLEAGHFDIVKRPSDVGELFAKLVEQLSESARRAEVALRTEMHLEERVFLFDPDRMLQVLSNLTSNALKFSSPGGEVVVRVEPTEPNRVRFSIIDHGPGIAPENRHRLFKHFQQIESAERRVRGGAGLGLVVSKSIVELHGGLIGMDETAGGGATFWFELPRSSWKSNSK